MAYVTDSALIAMLPGGEGATEDEAQELIDEWKEMVNEAYGSTASTPLTAPETSITRRIVREGAFIDLLRRVLIRDGYTDTEALDNRREAILAELTAYDALYSTPEEVAQEALRAYVMNAPF